MFDSKSKKSEEFIDHDEILKVLAFGEENKDNTEKVDEILKKAETLVGLDRYEVSVLLHACENTENAQLREKIFAMARKIKEEIYGKRIVMFAPLYVSNYCINGCKYCGYHCGSGIKRKKLTQEEVAEECRAIEAMGHKRIAMEAGEDPKNCDIDYILECMKTCYETKNGNGEIRRINVNIAATTVEDYKKLKEAGIGTYVLFQETYHKPTYEKLHPSGPKSDYDYHTTAHDRAMLGGIDDVGIGVLYGLYEYKYEVIGTMLHVKHLEDTFGVGPHTISIPRVRWAEGVDLNLFPNIVSDEQFKTIIAVLRLAVPYTGMIISTREEQNFRDEIISLGISQTSGGSCTGVGGYAQRLENGECDSCCDDQSTAQFQVADMRSEAEVSKALLKNGYIPSFCTACYREGRTGDRFMQLAKTGNISNCCLPNAMLTLAEYAIDYGDEEFNQLTFEVIKQERENIENEAAKSKFDEYLELIKAGQRDFRF
ncbi:MAG: [Oscillospiraceae bacterium]|nr:[FeFe] hydrogenase H-cluster radical SAM maturase HydG [Oscillospiraceae bacterium]